jgi:serine/threonine-protein kinase HipA
MCGEVWGNITKNLAQKIAGTNRGDLLKRAHWQQFARECGLNPRQVIDRVAVLGKSAIAQAQPAASEVAAMPAGDHAILHQTQQAVEQRARRLLSQLHEDELTTKAIGEEVEHIQSEPVALTHE